MATFISDWTENVTLHSSSSLTNGSSATDDIDLDNLGYYKVLAQIDIDIASGSPAGDVVVELFTSPDSGSSDDTIASVTKRIPFSATGNKKCPLLIAEVPYASVKVTNNTGVTVTYVGRYAGQKQTSS